MQYAADANMYGTVQYGHSTSNVANRSYSANESIGSLPSDLDRFFVVRSVGIDLTTIRLHLGSLQHGWPADT